MDLVEARKKAKELQAKQGTPPSPDSAAAAPVLKPEPQKPEPKAGKKKKAPAKARPQAPAKKIEAKESNQAAPKAPEKKPAPEAAPAPAAKEPIKPERGEDAFGDMNFGEDLPKVESADHELILEEKKPAGPVARGKPKPAEDKLRPKPAMDISTEKDFYELVVEDLVQYGYGELETKANLVELLGFRLGTETYAIPLVKIQQIIKPRPITLVPGAPHHILGIISLRGMIIPIFDLRRRLGLEPGPASRQSRIIIIKVGDNVLAGMFVDQVMEVARIPKDSIEDPHAIFSSAGPGMEAEFLDGIARHKSLMLIILNLERVVLGKNEEGKVG